MSMYLVAQLKIKYGYVEEACAILKEMVPHLEPHGWKLLATYTPFVGDFGNLYDIWEVPEANAVTKAIAAMSGNEEWKEIFSRWRNVCEAEHLSVCAKLLPA